MINFLKRLFLKTNTPTTELVVNIVWTKEDWWREGFDTNSIFRVKNSNHEQDLKKPSEFVIEAVTALATPLTCSLDRKFYEYGCYSATDIED